MITGHLVGDAGGVVTTVKTHWSGSEGGIADSWAEPRQFLDDAAPQPRFRYSRALRHLAS